jgi:hypothetical protein
MMRTLVLQSQREPLPHTWLEPCLASVRHWAALKNFEYRFIGDELFEPLDSTFLAKVSGQIVIATDLARLLWLRDCLNQGFERVIWLDADVLVFHPQALEPLDAACAVGREVWIQATDRGRLKAFRKVHNAFLMFRRNSAFLDFYIETAQRLVMHNNAGMPPQFIGPKLLTALHNVVQLPVQEDVGMLSPLLIEELLNEAGDALALLQRKSSHRLCAANLCSSSVSDGRLSDAQMTRLIDLLLQHDPFKPGS